MNNFDFHISPKVRDFFFKNLKTTSKTNEINTLIKYKCGINKFFSSETDIKEFYKSLSKNKNLASEPHRREYGDYQTNSSLTSQATNYVNNYTDKIEFVFEPTCGKGSFIISSLREFKKLKKVVGVEIYRPYVIETKFKILDFFLENPRKKLPDIDIYHQDAFAFSYDDLSKATISLKTLIIGNPPWVTNSELGAIKSQNLPQKSNFKKLNGFDALTGKGNFDIGESISLLVLKYFDSHEGVFAFLIKNSVVKNIIYDQKRNIFRISNSRKLNIDSKKEFNVSVNASLFVTQLNKSPEHTCEEFNFYTNEPITQFGWVNEKFVYSIREYEKSSIIDGDSKFIWRSGVKHDCSKIMELNKINGHFQNGYGEDISLEEQLVYGLLKSSDLKSDKLASSRKHTIITQKKIGQDTGYIQEEFPKTYKYLKANKLYFEKRKSSIYKDKPSFSIFGIGDYSFAKYKVAISGLYKQTKFSLVTTSKGKPLMLDDTCYFIGFDELKMAEIAHLLVNSDIVRRFLKSIIFPDAKRVVNKDILMRIDLQKAYIASSFVQAKASISNLNINHWEKFGELVNIPVE